MADAAEMTRSMMEAWDEEEDVQLGLPTSEVETPTPPPVAEPEEEEQTEEPDEEEEQPEEEVSAEEPEAPDEEAEAPDEEGEPEEEEEGEEEPDEEAPGSLFDTDDPVVKAFLSKYKGKEAEALKGAAHLDAAYGRQSSEVAALRQRVAELEGIIYESQALSNGSMPLNEQQRGWAEEAAASGNPGAYIRQALHEGQFDLARAVCGEWAQTNPFEAGRAGQYIDQVEASVTQRSNQPLQADFDQVTSALENAMPELREWWPQMAEVVNRLGPAHPLVQEAKSSDADQSMRGIIGLYEIAKASSTSVQEQKKEIKKRVRESADGARRAAAVSSASNSPKPSETPRPRQVMPGLTMDQLDTEFAQP